MELSDEIMKQINSAIDEYLHRKSQVDHSGIPLYPPSLAYTLNNIEIDIAEDNLRRSNQLICLVKTYWVSEAKVYYYKHLKGDFTIGMTMDNKLLTIS